MFDPGSRFEPLNPLAVKVAQASRLPQPGAADTAALYSSPPWGRLLQFGKLQKESG